MLCTELYAIKTLEAGDYDLGPKFVWKCNRIGYRKEGVTKLANEWIQYKDNNTDLPSMFMCFEKYFSPIRFVLYCKNGLNRPELVDSFEEDYKTLKSSITFWQAYGITKGNPTYFTERKDVKSITDFVLLPPGVSSRM